VTRATTATPRELAWGLIPGTLLAGVAGGIAFPILPIVGVKHGLPLAFIGAILAANRAVRVVASPLVGALADRIGGRRTMLLGLATLIVVMGLYTLGIVTGHVGTFFLVGRLTHGVASSCVFVSAQTLALHAGGASRGGSAAGGVRASMVIGVPIGLSVGGLLSDAVGDAGAFAIAGGAVVLAIGGAWLTVPDLRAPVAKRAPLAATLRAMNDRRLLAIGGLNFAVSFAAGGMVLTTLALAVHARHALLFGRNEQATAGLLMGVMTIVDATATPFAGRLGDAWHAHAKVATAGLAIVVPGLLVVGFATSAAGMAAGLALVGLGTSGLGPSVLVLMGAVVPAQMRGTGTGLLQLCGDVGGTLGPLVGTALFAGGTVTAYVASAVVVSAFVPVGLWLTRVERDARARPA
jgi:MFS family permease